MRVATVESTALTTIGYEQARALLQVEFRGRAIYHYFGVPASVHQGLLSAPSKGSYFNQAIRGRFPFCLICKSHADEPDPQGRSGASDRR